MIPSKVIYESPDGGETVYARPMGSGPEDRILITQGRKQIRAERQHLWHDILDASDHDPKLQDLLDRAELYYRLTNTLP